MERKDKKMSNHEKMVGKFYDDHWPEFDRWFYSETLGIHHGFYEEGIKTFEEAVYNMNNLVGKLLCLEYKTSMHILDAGCGVGGTSIYLAYKYPNITFTGITIAPDQVKLAKKFAKERHIKNAKFMLNSYSKTEFPDNYFDGVFALESSSYAENYNDFIDEMHRILKPGGRLVVIEGFRTDAPLNSIMQKIYNEFCRGYGHAQLPVIKTYEQYLKEKGFIEINVKNISKNVRRSLLKVTIIGLPFFLFKIVKRIIKFGKYRSRDDLISNSRGTNILACILGLSGTVGYYATSAVKNRLGISGGSGNSEQI